MSELENQEVSEEVNEETEEIQEEGQQEQAVLDAEKQKAAFEAGEKQRAIDAGWVDKSDFRGPGKNWRDYGEYNKRADEMMPIMRAELRGTKEENAALKKQLGGLESTVKKMTTMQDKFSEDFYDKSISGIKARKLEAVEASDTELYQQLDEQEAQIVKPAPVAEPEGEKNEETQSIPAHPEAVKFMEANPWFSDDPQLQEYAISVGRQLNEQNDPVAELGQQKAFYAKVEQKVKTMFAHKFKNPNQNKSDIVESRIRGGDTSKAENGAKGWDDLPVEAKQQCKKMMAEDEGYTKEEYVKYYPFDEE